MLQYKTIALPLATITVPKKDMYTQATADLALSNLACVVEAEAKGGWILHNYFLVPTVIVRKKTIYDTICFIFGRIPLLGQLLKFFQAPEGFDTEYIAATFVKET